MLKIMLHLKTNYEPNITTDKFVKTFTLRCLTNNTIFEELNSGDRMPPKNKFKFRNIGPKIIEEDEGSDEDFE